MAVTLGALALLAPACSGGGGSAAAFALDGSARGADDAGVLTAVTRASLTLDGTRTYRVDGEVRSFSALDLGTVPVRWAAGQYVQVGTDRGRVVWLSTLAKPLATDPPVVLYTGTVRSVDGDEITFANGTVLRLDPAVRIDAEALAGRAVRVTIDPTRHLITEVSS